MYSRNVIDKPRAIIINSRNSKIEIVTNRLLYVYPTLNNMQVEFRLRRAILRNRNLS